MKKYKLYKRGGYILTDWWYALPAIEVRLNDLVYGEPNFCIAVHFLSFHYRWLFLKKEAEDGNDD